MTETKIKYAKLPIELLVYEGDTDRVLNRMVLDFKAPWDRKIITKTAWWAMHNGHCMQTMPIKP